MSALLLERKLNVFLVDDDELDVMNVQRVFRKNQFRSPLFIAHDGVEALQMLRNGQVPDERRIILLDLNMPRMGGIEFLRELRADPKLRASSVIVLTTSSEDRDRVEAYNLNVAGYIVKPVTLTAFTDIMSALTRYWSLNELP
jgi:CheY-like chemotaxis protein